MKTIRKRFVFDDGAVAEVVASFRYSIGPAPAQYSGDAERIAAINGIPLSDVVYAETFSGWWKKYDGKGVRIETTEEGDWQVMGL